MTTHPTLIPEVHARNVAREYRRIFPEVTQTFYFLDPEEKDIRVLILNPKVIPEDAISVQTFPLTGTQVTVSLCEITPEQWDQVFAGQIFLPEHWQDFLPLEL